MNDEQKQNRPFPQEGSENGGNQKSGRNRRRHRGGKKHDRRTEQSTPDNQSGAPAQTDNRTSRNDATDNRSNGQKSKGENNQNGKARRRGRRRHGGQKDPRRGVADLYGSPTEADTLSPEELRAMIVVRAADGSAPSVPSPSFAKNEDLLSKNPLVSDAVPEEMNEPLSLPVDDQDLLASPEVLVPSTIPPEDRVDVVGVRFRAASKAYYFDPKGKTLHMGDFVVADTARGPEFGEVAFGNRAMNKKAITTPLRPILRVATSEDVARNKENRDREKEAGEVFYQKVREHRLAMKLIDVQFAFDNSKLLFYFTSEGRVDFRELVKDLAGVFRTRIELRQIGIRDEARLLGGLGACGRTLCCATFLPDFAQVSIKMAKEQGLSLNSAKISGACGRLMCCLRYEAESYAEEIRRTPPVGSTVKTPDGVGDVIGNNPIAATVRVKLKDQDAPKQYSRNEVTVISFAKRESAEKQNPS